MRKLLWFTLGFGAACALGTYFAPGTWLLFFCAISLLIYGSFSLVRHRGIAFAAVALAALGLTVGCCWFSVFDGVYLRAVHRMNGTTESISLYVRDYPEETDYGLRIDGTVIIDHRPYGCRLYLDSLEHSPQPGDTVKVKAELRMTVEGGNHEPTYHRTEGIFLLAYGEAEPAVLRGKDSVFTFPARLRLAVSSLLEELYEEDTQGFAKALLLGDKSALSYTQRNTLSVSGMSHVIAVSGMHLSIAYGMVDLLIFRRRFLSALVGLPAIWIFAAVAGFTPSVVRSAVMLSMSILAQLLNRDYDGPTALAVGALTLLVANPTVIAGVGFQLSLGAVAGIQCFSQPMTHWLYEKCSFSGVLGRIARYILSSFAVSLCAGVFTVPLMSIHFHMVSLIAPFTNALLLWAVNWGFYGGVGACILGSFWPMGGRILAQLSGWLIRLAMRAGELFAKIPFAAAYTQYNLYFTAVLICAGVLLCVFLLSRCKGKLILGSGLTFLLLLAILLPTLESSFETYRVTVLDVGQGQCVILQARGRTFVVDCGGTEKEAAGEAAARYLLTQGITRIDGLVITHYDDDHISGVPHFLSRMEADALYLPLIEDEPMCRELGSLGKRVFYVEQDLIITWEDVRISVFAPVMEGKSNESGLSVLFTVGKYDTLITGDMSISGEWQLLKKRGLADIELLIAGHHGSKHSTGDALLNILRPEQVAISVGEDNRYGHPAGEVLLRAKEHGCVIYRTDQAGTLIFRG